MDFSMSGQAIKSTEPQIVNVNVFPVADRIKEPTVDYTVGVEDGAPVPFGNTLTGMRVRDNGSTKKGNNPETETFSKVRLQVPADSATVIYNVTAGSFLPPSYEAGDYNGESTAKISYNSNDRVYEITSSIVADAPEIANISLADRKTASNDIMTTLSAFAVTIGPEHTDDNGIINVVATTLDVNLDTYSEKDNAFDHNIVILAVADVS